jgi:osmoprotectant transport system permease protein
MNLMPLAFVSDLLQAWARRQDSFWLQTWLFLSLTLRSLGLALLVGIPVGLVLTRRPRLASPVIALLAVLQTVPSLVLLGLLIPLLGIGQRPALFAAVVYSIFPVILNTYVGINQVAPAVRDAARGMGMSGSQVLWHVEVPLAFPVIMAGVRTGAIYASAMIVIGAWIGAAGLGDYIIGGMQRADNGLILLGTIPVLVLTLLLFWGLGGIASISRRNTALGMALGGGLIVLLSGYAVFQLGKSALQPRRDYLIVGSKDFTEGQILSEILKQTLENQTGLRVRMTTNLGTGTILKALKNRDIDLYPEYTGNLLTSKDALDLPVPDDKSTITDLVRREMRRQYGLVFLEPFGLNNTYAPTVTQETARRHRLKTISDLRRVPHLRVVIDQSFLTRPDGWDGLIAKYDLRFDRPPRQVGPDFLYRALEHNEADLVIGFATDWQIQALNLVVLADDRGYFPNYHAAPLVRAEVLQRYPQVQEALNRLAAKISDDTMRRLNYQVAVEKRSEAEVAGEFLRSHGLLEKVK